MLIEFAEKWKKYAAVTLLQSAEVYIMDLWGTATIQGQNNNLMTKDHIILKKGNFTSNTFELQTEVTGCCITAEEELVCGY